MKSTFINKSLNIIIKNQSYDDIELEKIKYGLEGIYLTFSKLIIILGLSIIFSITKEFIIFTVFYNIIRMFAFGMHASKSYVCLICSSIVFLLLPYLATIISSNIYINLIIGIFSLVMFFLYAPADTHKRPLINLRKRRRFKAMAILVGIIYLIISLTTKNSFLSNVIVFSLLSETILILPVTYKIFKIPYRNYQTYQRQNC